MLKKSVSSTPVLRYYNLLEEVTLQCDASQSGLGAALLQNGQPVAYASCALIPTETRYAQIEKELLAIVFACDHFESYIYGREVVQVETDDPVMQVLHETIRRGWPESKSDVPESIHPYFDVRDELIVEDELVFKGPLLVVPAAMRREMMAVAHASHFGIEGCISRA